MNLPGSCKDDEEDSIEWTAIWPHVSMPEVLLEPTHPFGMTVKYTAYYSDRPLHRGTHQNNRFCVHQAQKRGEGCRGHWEDESKSAVYPLYGRVLYYHGILTFLSLPHQLST